MLGWCGLTRNRREEEKDHATAMHVRTPTGHEWHCKVLGAIGHQMAWDKNQWLPKIKCYNFSVEVKG